ncbi:MAG TPA: phosphoribosyl-AMP cyclohydrolase [Actinomycetota bacterium]|nr:phosphoribosyl-AMP cyclohydrolase [Actinomycetota bacterium]
MAQETSQIPEIKWDARGLAPAIVQDSGTKQVLMLAWMNAESLSKTLATRTTWFFSRSRNELWNKGATSGNVQHVEEILFDCDSDAILVKVHPDGPACHTGETTCFFSSIDIQG